MMKLSSDVRQIITIVRFESEIDNWKRLVGNISLLGFATVLIAFIMVTATTVPATAELFSGYFLFPVYIFLTLAAIFFAGSSMATEFERKTSYMLFSNPIKRSTLLIGKFIASFIFVFLAAIVFYVGCSISTFYLYGTVPLAIVSSFFIALLYGGAVLGFVFLFGLISGTGMAAASFSFLILVLAMPITGVFLAGMGLEPWYMLTYAAGSINSFGGASMPGPTTIFGMSHQTVPNPLISAIVIIAYIVGLLWLSARVLKRRDIM